MSDEHQSLPSTAQLLARIEELERILQRRRGAMRHSAGKRAAVIVATITMALAITTTAFAGIPDTGGVVHGCYTNSSIKGQALLTLLDTASGKTCLANQTAITWNQTGPQGPKGDTGAAGATGTAGPQGPKGDIGPAGPAGTQGSKGDTGAAGPAGNDGGPGPKGDTGATGPQGLKGDTGPAGAQGPQGPTGPAGSQGPPGAGLAGLDSLKGTVCNTGTPEVGTLSLSYSDSSNITMTCVPSTLYILSVTKAGGGSGTVTSSPAGIDCGSTCSASFIIHKVVTLTAVAQAGSASTGQAGSVFSGWSGDCTGSGPTCTVTMDAARNVTATFSPTLLVVVLGTGGGGTVTGLDAPCQAIHVNPGSSTTCSVTYPSGTVVQLTATPGPGTFGGWLGDCTGLGSCTLTMDAPKTVGARFNP